MSKWQDPVSWMMLQHDDPVLFQKKLRTNRNQSNRNPQPPLFILWYNISTIRWLNKTFLRKSSVPLLLLQNNIRPIFEEVIKHSTENHGSLMYFSINIRWHSQNVSSDSRKWLIKHLFPPSSCKKQINEHNSYLLTIRFRSGIRYARVQTFFAESVCTQWALMLTYSPLFVYKQERIIRFNQNGIIFELLTANPYMNQRTHPTCIYNV
jgi:hypothetical protein